MIWNYALTNNSRSLHYNGRMQRFDVSHIGAGLLSTCRSISLETLYIPLRLNVLVFDVDQVGYVDFTMLWVRLEGLAGSHGFILDVKIVRDGRLIS